MLSRLAVGVSCLLLIVLGVHNCLCTLWSNYDTWLISYMLEHSYKAVFSATYRWSIDSPPYYFPARYSLGFFENLLGTAPLYWAVRAVAAPRVAYAVWALTLPSLCLVSMVWLSRRLQVNWPMSLWAGYLFAFGLPRVMHVQVIGTMLPQFMAPVSVYCAWRFLQRPQMKWFIGTLLLSYWQFLSAMYLGWFHTLSLLMFAGAYAMVERSTWSRVRDFVRANRVTVVLGCGLWIGAAVWLMWPYLKVDAMSHSFSDAEVNLCLPRWTSWLTAPDESVVWSRLSVLSAGLPDEQALFLGVSWFLVLILALVQLARSQDFRHSDVGRFVGAGFLVAATWCVLTMMWPGDFSLWTYLRHVLPGASGMRGVDRVWSVVYLFGLPGAAAAVPRVRPSLAVLILLVGIMEQQVCPLADATHTVDKTVAQLSALLPGCDTAYATFQAPTSMASADWRVMQLGSMWAGLQTRVPVVNGYASYWPAHYKQFWLPMSATEVIEWLGNTKPRKALIIYSTGLDPQDPMVRLYAQERRLSPDGTLCGYLLQTPLHRTFQADVQAGGTGQVRVRNTGECMWWRDGRCAVHLQVGSSLVPLPTDLGPGREAVVSVPAPPGGVDISVVQSDVLPQYRVGGQARLRLNP